MKNLAAERLFRWKGADEITNVKTLNKYTKSNSWIQWAFGGIYLDLFL
jgi:hypothetical protein